MAQKKSKENPKKNKENPLNIFKEKFEATIIYKGIKEGKIALRETEGVIEIESNGNTTWVLVFGADPIIPKSILPYHIIIEIIPEVEDLEENTLEDDFDLSKISAEIIEDGGQKTCLDLESKIKTGTDSMGDIDLNTSNPIDQQI